MRLYYRALAVFLSVAWAIIPCEALAARPVRHTSPLDSRIEIGPSAPGGENAYQLSEPLLKMDVSKVTELTEQQTLEELFRMVRDERFVFWPQMPKFARRTTWLYPWDGCFMRAAHMRMVWERHGLKPPTKIYVFPGGDLLRLSGTSPYYDMTVDWIYHVAHIVKVKGQLYVLDPAADPHRPLPLNEWALKMAPDLDSIEGTVCSPYASDVSEPCQETDPSLEYEGIENYEERYLAEEWDQVEYVRPGLPRDPNVILGDHPLWEK
jgi:hypothetical protein